MSTFTRRSAALLVGVALIFGVSACSGADETAVENAIENANPSVDADVQDGGKGITATDEAGNEVGIGSSASVPEGFPSAVPLPAEGTLQVAAKSPDGTFSLTYKIDGDAAAAANAYKGQLTSAGFTVESEASAAALGGFEATGNGYTVIVLALPGGANSGLTLAVEAKK
jgi:hypothetical protein